MPPYNEVIKFPDQVPIVTIPLLRTTPDMLEGTEVLENIEPPIPTPPETVNAPVDVLVLTVECEIFTTPVEVLFVNVVEPDTDAPVAENNTLLLDIEHQELRLFLILLHLMKQP